MQSILRLMASEAGELRPGGEAVITRLGDILVIQAIRAWMASDPAAQRGGWGRSGPDRPRHPHIHRDPARNWTVASLAHELAMSRSAFAALHAELVGEPVMSHVARWHARRGSRAEGGGRRSASSPTASAFGPGGLQPRLQARHRRLAGRDQA